MSGKYKFTGAVEKKKEKSNPDTDISILKIRRDEIVRDYKG